MCVPELVNRTTRSSSAMKDATIYRRYADDCMKLARAMPEHREQLVAMAATWQLLADAAEKKRDAAEAPAKE